MQKAFKTRLIVLRNLATSRNLDRKERNYKMIRKVSYKRRIFFRLVVMTTVDERKRETGEKMRGNEKETHGFSFLIMTGKKKERE